MLTLRLAELSPDTKHGSPTTADDQNIVIWSESENHLFPAATASLFPNTELISFLLNERVRGISYGYWYTL